MSFLNLCVNPIKDVLADLRAGRLGRWEFPDDVCPDFKQHMNAERKVSIVAGRDNRQVQIWQRIGKKDNHLLDTEMAATGFMMMRGHVKARE
jgi:phage terminase large subunit GpA-like protein